MACSAIEIGSKERWLIAASVSVGLFAAALDTTVNVALPALADSFDVDFPALQWIIIAFVATNTALSVGAGSAADRFGLERFFRWGLVLYAAAMPLIAFAPNLPVLVALRVLQGVAASAVLTVGPVLVASAFPAGIRGRVLGITAGTQAAGMVASGFGGGLLIQTFGWQAIFLGRLPFLFVAFLRALVAVRGHGLSTRVSADALDRRFDLAGAVVLVVALGSLLLGLNLVGRAGGPLPALTLVLATVAAVAFVLVERRAAWPILDLALFRQRPFSVALAALLLNSLGVFTIWFIFPFFVANVLGYGARALGVLFGIQGLAMAVSSPLGGWLADRVHPPHVMVAAGIAVAAGLVSIARLDADSSILAAALPLVLTGAGQGALGPAAWTLVLNRVPPERLGTASGALNLGRSMGVVLSVALFSAIFATREDAHLAALVGDGLNEVAARLPAHIEAFRETFRLAALVALAGAACSLLAWRRDR